MGEAVKRISVLVAVLSLAGALTGCASSSTSADPARTPSATQTSASGPLSTPTPTPAVVPTAPAPAVPAPAVADYTVLGFSAQRLWDACQAGVVAQNDWREETYPGITTLQPLTADGVRDAGYQGHVLVQAPSALLQDDGQPMALWVCEFSGDPAAPKLEHADIADK